MPADSHSFPRCCPVTLLFRQNIGCVGFHTLTLAFFTNFKKLFKGDIVFLFFVLEEKLRGQEGVDFLVVFFPCLKIMIWKSVALIRNISCISLTLALNNWFCSIVAINYFPLNLYFAYILWFSENLISLLQCYNLFIFDIHTSFPN